MKVKVLQVKEIGKGRRFALVQAGELFGEVPAMAGVKVDGPAILKSSLNVRDGRLQSSLRVEPIAE